jgi:hypothetical protein
MGGAASALGTGGSAAASLPAIFFLTALSMFWSRTAEEIDATERVKPTKNQGIRYQTPEKRGKTNISTQAVMEDERNKGRHSPICTCASLLTLLLLKTPTWRRKTNEGAPSSSNFGAQSEVSATLAARHIQ